MSRPVHTDAVWSLDDLELELRKLPGVRAAGFDDNEDLLLVQLHVADDETVGRHERTEQSVPVTASRIAARHADRPVTVEVVRWRSMPAVAAPPAAPESSAPEPSAPEPTAPSAPAPTEVVETPAVPPESATMLDPSRARLLAVLAFPDTDELEVHLVLDGKRTIGRAPASRGVEGAVAATVEAVRELSPGVHPRMRWARALDEADIDGRIVVAVALDDVDTRSPSHYGLAAGSSLIDAAARATLDALNRHLTRAL